MHSDTRPDPIALSLPDRLSSAEVWHPHLSFGLDLVAMLRPRLLVEVGTRAGDSFCAFCQAVKALALETRCFGFGVWPGAADREALGDLRVHHDARYGSFSTLAQAGPEEAPARFDDGTVDLLHLDGLGSLARARRALELWLPKLSPRAVLLLHEVAAVEADAGAPVLWAELEPRFPGLRLPAGRGLGVLAVGPEAPARLRALCGLPPEERARAARLYEALGERAVSAHRLATLQRSSEAAERRQAGERARLEEAVRDQARERERIEDGSRRRIAYLEAALAATRRELDGLSRSRAVKAAAWVERQRLRLSTLVGRVWREPVRALRRRVRHARYERRIRRSGLLDAEWYLRTYPDVAASGLDPVAHFVWRGAAAGYDPNPWFDTSWYVDHNHRAASRGRNPLVHYLRHPTRDPHPEFSTTAYLASYPGLATSRRSPLLHFLRSGARETDPEYLEARGRLASGVMNGAWYGGTSIEHLSPAVEKVPEVLAMQIDRADTRALERYVDPMGGSNASGPDPSFLARSFAPLADAQRRLVAAEPSGPARATGEPASFTVVTPFYRHREHLEDCARSVEALVSRSGGVPFEWVVVNDDPAITAKELERSIPASLHPVTRVLSDGARRGIVERLNEGIRAARHEWILFVDCDDLVSPDAIAVLRRYIERFPRCRYVSSSMIDVGERGELIRYRRRTSGPAHLLAAGMTAGHLKAVRRDAFEQHGLLEAGFEGCQDYDFALRMAMEEPLLYAPEYLYSYRWHRNSQSVGQARRQARTADAIVRRFALRLLGRGAGASPAPASAALPERGVAVVRTQGMRNELLLEALHSIRTQLVPLHALVVVHGPSDAFASVRDVLSGLPDVELLHVPDTSRLRGHPLNVALRHVYASVEAHGFVCFLDDDDVLYPLFSSRMHAALSTTGADLVHAASNKRVLGRHAEPAYAPLPAPCLLVQNFIPINAYAVRTEALARRRLLFDEGLHYMEDWDFLVRALGSGIRFAPLEDVLSEFRLTGDGNLPVKQHPQLWAAALRRIQPEIARAARAVGREGLLASMLEFPAHLLEGLDDDARRLVLSTRSFIDTSCAEVQERGGEVAS